MDLTNRIKGSPFGQISKKEAQQGQQGKRNSKWTEKVREYPWDWDP